MTSDTLTPRQRTIRARNRALFAVLFTLAAIFYAVTLVRLSY